MRLEIYINIIILVLTFLGFVIGFINPEFRLLAWALSIIMLTILVLILFFRDYLKKIENNENEIIKIKKDLNIFERLSKLEGKVEVLTKNEKR